METRPSLCLASGGRIRSGMPLEKAMPDHTVGSGSDHTLRLPDHTLPDSPPADPLQS